MNENETWFVVRVTCLTMVSRVLSWKRYNQIM